MAWWRRGLAVAIVVCAGLAPLQAQRLPGGATPEHYALTITPDLNAGTFAGEERIDVLLDKPSNTITLNAAEIEFISVRARGGALKAESLPATVSLDANREQATFRFERELPAGRVTLAIAYTGRLNDKLRGFYLSKTSARSYGVTQFESTDARRAFPCFDEPALKATFDISLVIAAGDMAISNTPPVSDIRGSLGGTHTVRFATTPRMSTYLLAWLVGDFACSEGKSDGVPVRVCATPDKARLTKFALEAAKWDLHFYNRYFGIRYPLAKLDLIAVPDFDSGAMENFGCITFRESELLVDAKSGTLPARKDVTTTVAHEIAHQWFGDLVTPQWWNDLWLNEGFATWMETKASAEQHPDWRFAEDAALDLDHAMSADSAAGTRAIRSSAETPAEIDALFDEIAYDKAGAVIGMVEHWVGDDLFRRGVQQYLKGHLYSTASAEDFWTTQTRVSGLPVDAVMRSYMAQPGVPLVEISGAGTQAAIRQSRFFSSQEIAGTASQRWDIPLCFSGAHCQVITPETVTVDVPATGFYANAGQKGYYRTSYAPELLPKLAAAAESTLTPPERMGLLGDRWALMRAGRAPVGQVLDLAFAMVRDPDPPVLEDVLMRLETVSSTIATGEDRRRFDAVLRSRLGPLYAAMGGPSAHESDDHAELREALFEALGKAGDPAVLAQAAAIAGELLNGHKPPDGGLSDAAVALTAPTGDAAMYDRMLRVVERTTEPDLKDTAQRLLTHFRSPELAARTLEYALSGSVRSQDSASLLALMLGEPAVQTQAWNFVQAHWGEVLRKGPADAGPRVVAATGAFCSVEQEQSVTAFFAAHPVEGAERTLRHSLEQIHDCVELRQTQQPLLRQWLEAQQQETASSEASAWLWHVH